MYLTLFKFVTTKNSLRGFPSVVNHTNLGLLTAVIKYKFKVLLSGIKSTGMYYYTIRMCVIAFTRLQAHFESLLLSWIFQILQLLHLSKKY